MAPTANTPDRHRAQLQELADLGMALARDLQAAALAAEAPAEKAELAQAFHRVARTVRQSMALQARLAREARRDVIETQQHATTARKAQVRARVRDMVWNEAEPSDCHALIHDLDDRLSDAEHLPAFAHEAVEQTIARLRAELGLTPGVPAARRRSAQPDGGGPVEIKVVFVDPLPGEEDEA